MFILAHRESVGRRASVGKGGGVLYSRSSKAKCNLFIPIPHHGRHALIVRPISL